MNLRDLFNYNNRVFLKIPYNKENVQKIIAKTTKELRSSSKKDETFEISQLNEKKMRIFSEYSFLRLFKCYRYPGLFGTECELKLICDSNNEILALYYLKETKRKKIVRFSCYLIMFLSYFLGNLYCPLTILFCIILIIPQPSYDLKQLLRKVTKKAP